MLLIDAKHEYILCCLTEHFDSACRNRQDQEENAQKNTAAIAGMRKNMDTFLKKCTGKPAEEGQCEEAAVPSIDLPREVSLDYDSDRDLDLDSTM